MNVTMGTRSWADKSLNMLLFSVFMPGCFKTDLLYGVQ